MRLFDASPQQGVRRARLGRGSGDFKFHFLHAGEKVFDLLEIQPLRRILRRALEVGDGGDAVIQRVDGLAVGVVFLRLVRKGRAQAGVGLVLWCLDPEGLGQTVKVGLRGGLEVVEHARQRIGVGWRGEAQGVDLFHVKTKDAHHRKDGRLVRVRYAAGFQFRNVALALLAI